MDWVLRQLVFRARRRGLAGEPLWLAVAGAAWLVRRARAEKGTVLWSGRVSAGERLVIDVADRRSPAPAAGSGAAGE